jgi:hypothetical protein
MNTGDTQNDSHTGEDAISQAAHEVLTRQLHDIASANNQSEEESIESRPNLHKLETEIVSVFKTLGQNIAKYEWQQTEIENSIRILLHRVNSQYDRDSQISRMALQLAKEIASQNISEDERGEVSVTGYNKQFRRELEVLGEYYKYRKNEVIAALAMANDNKNPDEQAQIIQNGVERFLEETAVGSYETFTELLNIVAKQRESIYVALEQFKGLQYFKEAEAWQDPTIRLLIECAEAAIVTIDIQKEKLKQQIVSDNSSLEELVVKAAEQTNNIKQLAKADKSHDR